MTMTRGVTATEFAQICQKHMPKAARSKFPVNTARPFLERCCVLGLLSRESRNGTTPYFATAALYAFALE